MRKKNENIIYSEGYKNPGLKHETPPILCNGIPCSEAYTIEAGIIKTNEGKRREYQIIKVYFDEDDINNYMKK